MRLIILFMVLACCPSAHAQQKQNNKEADRAQITIKEIQKRDSHVVEIGIDTAELDSIFKDLDSLSYDASNAGFSTGSNSDYDSFSFFPFNMSGERMTFGILISILSIVFLFAFPLLIVLIALYFKHKNRQARYRLMEQAIAAGQPIPEDFIKGYARSGSREKGIKNTFVGLGLFIFLWAITGSFGIGCVGLLVMFSGIGEWYSSKRKENKRSGEE